MRALDAPGDSIPSLDLVAMYIRTVGDVLQIRLDFLDLDSELNSDLFLVFDSGPGGNSSLPLDGYREEANFAWDALIVLPGSGPIQAIDADQGPLPGMKLRVQRDPFLDMVVVTLKRSALPNYPADFKLVAFLSLRESDEIADTLGPVHSNGQPPPRLPVLIAFWNTLQASSPVQALRAWDGAHSGPDSERHGLKSIVEAVKASQTKASQTPVFLLDLKTPRALSALDYLGALPEIRSLARKGDLVLPDVVPIGLPLEVNNGTSTTSGPYLPDGWVFNRAADESRRTGLRFGLPASQILYTQVLPETLERDYNVFFTGSSDDGNASLLLNLINYEGNKIVPLPSVYVDESRFPEEAVNQATPDGPSLQLRSALLEAAVNNGELPGIESQFYLLGGDLANNSWGEPSAARNTMHYLASRPWIKILSESDLLAIRPTPQNSLGHLLYLEELRAGLQSISHTDTNPNTNGSSPEWIQERLLEQLKSAQEGPLRQAAWQAYLSMLIPGSDIQYQLRANYMGRINQILAAAGWASQPTDIADCQQDLDWDGKPECILASKSLFAVFELEGGRLIYAVAVKDGEIHQLIAPSSQFAIGMSDPSLWKPEQGKSGDPGQIPGAFSDSIPGSNNPTWEVYQPEISAGQLYLTHPNQEIRKTFEIIPGGLRVRYQTSDQIKVRIPFAIDSWQLYQPGWANTYTPSPSGPPWNWGYANGFQIGIYSTAKISFIAFNDARSVVDLPEDPNYDYPLGHYLPFPFGVALVEGQGEFVIQVTFN